MKYSIFINIIISAYFLLLLSCVSESKDKPQNASSTSKPRVIISTDIGGTDPDDNQSMIHYLMYADKFQTEGLISSPYGEGRASDILKMIDLYENDLPQLKVHRDLPDAAYLRSITKQGALEAAPPQGYHETSEGSDWIVKQAKKDSEEPLWVLVWGGLEDVAQALHDAPEIAEKIRVYWIGGPNKKWSVHSYLYIARNFPDLWMIEANATYRGWFDDTASTEKMKNEAFYNNFMKGRGVLGTDFINYYEGSIKMGDTPSVAYLLNGDPDDPEGESWGGSFTRLPYSAFRAFGRNTSSEDTVPTYSVIEWEFKAKENGSANAQEIWMQIDGQRIDGFYEGNGVYKVRFVPKRIGNWEYTIHCDSESLQGQTGAFVSANPWPGVEHSENIKLNHWWSDTLDEERYLGEYQGAQTVAKWREDYLKDWADRLLWLDDVQ